MLNVSYSNNSLNVSHQKWEKASDLELWKAFTHSDEEAFAFIYENFSDQLYSYGMQIRANNSLVQDCIHDLFVDLWRQRSNLASTDNIKYYLFRALRRRIAYVIKREKKLYADREQLNVSDVVITLPFENTLINQQMEDDRKDRLIRVLAKLSERQKEAIELIFFHGMSYEQVADIMSINVRSVYTLTWKAISSMKKHLIEMLTFPLVFIFF